ncbi:MAG: ribonuclease R [Pseudomonadales bacterium]
MSKSNDTNTSAGNLQQKVLNARRVIDLLVEHPVPITWQQMVEILDVPRPHGVKRLRQILRGLVRLGEIVANENREYLLSPAKARKKARPLALSTDPVFAEVEETPADDALSGVVTGLGPRLFVDGIALAKPERGALSGRPSDEIEYKVVDEQALVTRILKYSPRPLVGVLNLKGKVPQVDPLGRSFNGRIRLGERPDTASHGDTVRVQILDQDRNGLFGTLVDVLKSDSVIEQAISSTLDSLDIPTEWPDVVGRAVSRLPKSVQLGQHPDRVDLTQTPLVTIDGETAKDFDDAVYAKSLGGRKGWQVMVAIADVAHYVKPNSALDTEAQNRTTSVYLPSFVVPMLPEGLSNELCSLKPDVYRLALVCEMTVSVKGVVREHKFYEAVIRSHGRLTYEQVQAHLDNDEALPCNKEDMPGVLTSVAALKQVFLAFSQAKDDRGGLDFNSREGVIEIEHGHVTGVTSVPRLMAHQIIEEAMINANVCAATFIEANDSRSLYRVHDRPDSLKLEELRQDLMSIGLSIPQGVPSSLSYKTLLGEMAEKPNGWLYQQLVLRSMKQAVYTPENKGHFGLGLERYMHFTSPIRRYPDLLVHRAIKAILQVDKNRQKWVPDDEKLAALGEQCSNNERRAESAGWTVEAWLKCELLRQHVGETVRGTIATVTEFGLFIEIEEYYVQGLLHISDLGSDYFRFDRRNQCLYGERNGKRFTLGDEIEVLVVNVEPPQGKIELRLTPSAGGGDDRRKVKSRRKNSPERAEGKNSPERAEGKNSPERSEGKNSPERSEGKNSPERSSQKSFQAKSTEPKSPEDTAEDANDPWAASKRKIRAKAEAGMTDTGTEDATSGSRESRRRSRVEASTSVAENPATESSPSKKPKKKKKGKSNADVGKKKVKKKVRAKPRSKFADKG